MTAICGWESPGRERELVGEGNRAGLRNGAEHIDLPRGGGGQINEVVRLEIDVLRHVAGLEEALKINCQEPAAANEEAAAEVRGFLGCAGEVRAGACAGYGSGRSQAGRAAGPGDRLQPRHGAPQRIYPGGID